MRTVIFRYSDSSTLESDLGRASRWLPLPRAERPVSVAGEWVLAVFKVDDGRSATASAARIEERDGVLGIAFAKRDWLRLSTELLADTPRDVPRRDTARLTDALPPKTMPLRQPSAFPADVSAVVPAIAVESSAPPAAAKGKSSRGPVEFDEGDQHDQTLEASLDTLSKGMRTKKARPPRLLFVEDDVTMQEVVREMLEAIGLDVEGVPDAESALDRLVLQSYDLVVLDWMLPGMSGLELCREIRRHPKLAPLPVLFLTAKSSSRDLVDAFAAGADDFVAKPFRAPELGARLLALLRRAKIGLSSSPRGE